MEVHRKNFLQWLIKIIIWVTSGLWYLINSADEFYRIWCVQVSFLLCNWKALHSWQELVQCMWSSCYPLAEMQLLVCITAGAKLINLGYCHLPVTTVQLIGYLPLLQSCKHSLQHKILPRPKEKYCFSNSHGFYFGFFSIFEYNSECTLLHLKCSRVWTVCQQPSSVLTKSAAVFSNPCWKELNCWYWWNKAIYNTIAE